MLICHLLCIVLLVVISTTFPAAAEELRGFLWTHGRLTILPSLGGDDSRANGINKKGEIVGYSTRSDGCCSAVSFSRNRISELPMLPEWDEAVAYALNDSGIVVGQAGLLHGPRSPVMWNHRGVLDLGNPPGFSSGMAIGVNNALQILINAQDPVSHGHAFVWRDAVFTDIGLLPGANFTLGVAINNLGQLVGLSGFLDNNRGVVWQQPVLWLDGVLSALSIASGIQFVPFDINDLGQIAGRASIGGNDCAAMWNPVTGVTCIVPAPPRSFATAINNDGAIVGWRDGFGGFLWQNGALTSLGLRVFPSHINDKGQIVGHASVGGPGGSTTELIDEP
jgi:uncharacterized membrane protein